MRTLEITWYFIFNLLIRCYYLLFNLFSLLPVWDVVLYKRFGQSPYPYHLFLFLFNRQSCPTLQPPGLQHVRFPCPSLSSSLLKLMSIKLMMPSNHLILCRPLFLLPSIFPSIRVFFNESALHIRFCQSIGASASASVLPMNIQG